MIYEKFISLLHPACLCFYFPKETLLPNRSLMQYAYGSQAAHQQYVTLVHRFLLLDVLLMYYCDCGRYICAIMLSACGGNRTICLLIMEIYTDGPIHNILIICLACNHHRFRDIANASRTSSLLHYITNITAVTKVSSDTQVPGSADIHNIRCANLNHYTCCHHLGAARRANYPTL